MRTWLGVVLVLAGLAWGQEGPRWVGFMRLGWGNPYPGLTEGSLALVPRWSAFGLSLVQPLGELSLRAGVAVDPFVPMAHLMDNDLGQFLRRAGWLAGEVEALWPLGGRLGGWGPSFPYVGVGLGVEDLPVGVRLAAVGTLAYHWSQTRCLGEWRDLEGYTTGYRLRQGYTGIEVPVVVYLPPRGGLGVRFQVVFWGDATRDVSVGEGMPYCPPPRLRR